MVQAMAMGKAVTFRQPNKFRGAFLNTVWRRCASFVTFGTCLLSSYGRFSTNNLKKIGAVSIVSLILLHQQPPQYIDPLHISPLCCLIWHLRFFHFPFEHLWKVPSSKAKYRIIVECNLKSEVQSKLIIMGHQILSCHVPLVRSFFIL